MQDAILILGASNDQLFMIQTAHDMGLQTVVVDANKASPGFEIANYSQAINFSQVDLVIDYVEELVAEGVNIIGVTSMGSDIPHLIARISKHFSWQGPDVKSAQIATDKYLMKQVFSDNNIAVPQYALISNFQEIENIWLDWACESLIIKPVDAAGSKGVSIISDNKEIKRLFELAKANSKTSRVMIEEFIDGDQISTESIVYSDEIYHVGFADRVYNETLNFYPSIMENGGWQPSQISQHKYDIICDLIKSSAQAIGLQSGVIKGDVVWSTKYNKPMIIEVALRLSGGDFSASLVPLAHGINYVKTVIEIAINKVPDIASLTPKYHNVVANRYFFLPQGSLEKIEGIDQIKQMTQLKKLEFNYNIGDNIPRIENHGQRVGVFVVCGKTQEKVQQLVDIIYNTIIFKINGNSYSGHPKYYK